MTDFRYRTSSRYPSARTAFTRVEISVEVRSTERRSLELSCVLRHEGNVFASGDTGFTWLPSRLYHRLRSEHSLARPNGSPPPVPPSLVGRITPAEVALAACDEPDRWQLRPDTGHTALMDHPVDHVPGLILIEAAHQAAYAFAAHDGFRSNSVEMTCARFVEFDAPCWISVRDLPSALPGERVVEITGTQGDQSMFRCLHSSAALD